MEAAPSASFIVAKPEFLLQFLIVALDPPAQFGEIDEIPQRHIGWQTGQPILRRFGFPVRPLDQTPFFRSGADTIVVTMRWPHPHRSKSRHQFGVAAFTPGDPMPLLFRQTQRQFLGGYRFRAASRRINFGGRPLPLQRFGGLGAVPGAQTMVEDWMPAT